MDDVCCLVLKDNLYTRFTHIYVLYIYIYTDIKNM